MSNFKQSAIPKIESEYTNLSESERKVADYFIGNRDRRDFSARKISKELYVSEATLSRFSKKIGFNGYREFIFFYEQSLNQEEMKFTDLTQNVLGSYNELLHKTNSLINEKQIRKLALKLSQAKHVYVYGEGNSGMSAQEFKIRFMRLGMHVEATSDHHIMKMNTVLMDHESVLIAMSVSGKNLRSYLKDAKKQHAYTIMITANNSDKLESYCDEVLLCASLENLDVGNVISPQFPILVIIDILYAHYYYQDFSHKSEYLNDTLNFVEK